MVIFTFNLIKPALILLVSLSLIMRALEQETWLKTIEMRPINNLLLKTLMQLNIILYFITTYQDLRA